MKKKQIALFKLHLAVIIFGFTAVFGKLITLDEGPLVWYRMLIASIGLLFLPRLWKGLREIKRKDAIKVSLTGGIVALHWVTFFGGIKLSNVSVALCMMATSSLFTSILEPIILKKKFSIKEVLLGLMVLPGIFIIFQISYEYILGMAVGVLSAFLAALFGSINKTFADKVRPVTVSFLELSTGFVFLSLLMPLYMYWKPDATLIITEQSDLMWLIVLGIVCTSFAFLLIVDVLKDLSAFTTALAINLEPIYGILLAIVILKENKILSINFYIGATLIVAAVLLNGLLKNREIRFKPLTKK